MHIPCHQVSLFCMFSVIHWLQGSSQDISLPGNLAHHLRCSYRLTRSHLLGKTSLTKRTNTCTMKIRSPKQRNDKKNKTPRNMLIHTHDSGCNVWQVQVIFDIPKKRWRIQNFFFYSKYTLCVKNEDILKKKLENTVHCVNHSCHILT